jgi:hypothetical protein
MTNKTKVVLKRFLKGALSGAVSTASVIVVMLPQNTFAEVSAWIGTVMSSLLVGAISGGILAVDKYVNYKA